MNALTDLYLSRFANRYDIWARQTITPDGETKYYWQQPNQQRYRYRPLDQWLVRDMLAGKITFSFAAIDADHCGKWLAFDDDGDIGELDKLAECLKDWDWQIIREGRRPGRGGHLWLLFDAPIPASDLIVLGDTMMRAAGVKGLERFPKSPDKWSALRAPLSVHRKPGANARAWFEVPEKEIRKQLLWLSEQPLNSAADAIALAEKHRPRQKIKRKNKRTFENVIPILQLVEPRRVGKQFVAPCPICQSEGHDKHGDNLQISLDGERFCCVYGGPAMIHKAPEIIRALRG